LNGQPTPFRALSCFSQLIGQEAGHSSIARTSRTTTRVNQRETNAFNCCHLPCSSLNCLNQSKAGKG
jgi:hypothetical protein